MNRATAVRALAGALLYGALMGSAAANDLALPHASAVPGGVVLLPVPALRETPLHAPPALSSAPRAWFGDAPVLLLPRTGA
ncbi:MAG: hypothetical protein JSR15_08455, partial [Proteobacteria bacterium]|nr:hypothetical protein [Pseudomonadota bacterium]